MPILSDGTLSPRTSSETNLIAAATHLMLHTRAAAISLPLPGCPGMVVVVGRPEDVAGLLPAVARMSLKAKGNA